MRRFFLGEGAYRTTELKVATISAQTKALCELTGAIPKGSPLKAEHLRHSALSFVYYVCPSQIQEALLRSRHSRDTFLKHYDIPIAQEQRDDFDKLDSSELDVILMG